MASMLHLGFFAASLLTIQPTPVLSQIPSYAQTFERAAAILNATQHGTQHLWRSELQKSWPLLLSPTLFQHKFVEATESLARKGSFLADLPYNLSAVCVSDFEHVLTSLAERKGWAWQMVDAMGKPPPDLKDFNLLWLGAYQECLDVRALNSSGPNSSQPSSAILFSGRHCFATAVLTKASAASPIGASLRTSLCVPDSCSSYDVTVLMNLALLELNITLPSIPYAVCHESNPPLDGLAIAGIVVAGLFAVLMLVGTVADVVRTQLARRRQEDLDGFSTNSAHNLYNQDDDIILLGRLPPAEGREPGIVLQLLLAFSVWTNGAKLLSGKRTSGTLTSVHGLRFFSMTWVVLGHTFLIPIYAGSNLLGFFSKAMQRWTFQGIINATVSVDSFFVLSGLLVGYLSLKEMKRKAGRINWFKFYFHRFWRLTPAYMLIILMYVSLGKYWGEGPGWTEAQQMLPDRDNCKKYWWTNLLYINNFVHADKMCLGQSWYLANDMQFYILSPLIFVPLYYSPVYGMVSALVFLLATTIASAALTVKDHFGPNGFAVDVAPVPGTSYNADFYGKPYCRMGPYIIGMVTGYFLYRTDCRLRINKAVNLLCWAVATASALAVLYGLSHTMEGKGHPVSLPVAALYNAVGRTVWGAAVAWVVFACVTGNGGFVDTILSWKALVPLSRLTYCIYLLHIMVLTSYLYSENTAFYMSDANVVVLFLACLVFCYMISSVVSLAFEAPMLAIEKIVLNYKRAE